LLKPILKIKLPGLKRNGRPVKSNDAMKKAKVCAVVDCAESYLPNSKKPVIIYLSVKTQVLVG